MNQKLKTKTKQTKNQNINQVTKLPPYTKSQKRIIFFLYSFRYAYIPHFQKHFNHKYPNRIQEWLKDLHNNGYIYIIKNEKDKTKPYIFCLEQSAAHILNEDKDIDPYFLKRLYKEKNYSNDFINKNLFLVDCYLYFEKHKAKGSEVNFFTRTDLYGYTYFPKPLPDAYIDVKEGNINTRYFLDIFDESKKPSYWKKRIKYYFQYFDEGEWKENTNNTPFPVILIVCQTERMKWHYYYIAKSYLERAFTDKIEIYLTTKDRIQEEKEGLWKRVVI